MAAARATQLIPHLIDNYALNTNIVGVLHLLLTRAPEKIREPLLNQLRKRFSEGTIAKIITVLKWLTIVAWTKKVNDRLNAWALNNWVWKAQTGNWTWGWEVAVVTGGCSGIGKEIVKGLTAAGIKVALLDIQELPKDLEQSKLLAAKQDNMLTPKRQENHIYPL
jgi:all-trans-retinol dehydrogenase (NAD+)